MPSARRRWTIRVELRWIADVLKNAGCGAADPGEGYAAGVSIDTRTDCAGALFIALAGEHTDGHLFIREAALQGAAAMLVSMERKTEAEAEAGGIPVLAVRDTVLGLQTLAAAYRRKVNPRVIAITGSAGKTGTKDLIASILRGSCRVHATPGNLNNHIGLPLTMLGMKGGEDVLVTEMGANHKNEIRDLAGIAAPEIGVITNIGPSHLEFFGSLKEVAAAKAELVEALAPEGTAVLPADDEFFPFLRGRTKARVVSFGLSMDAEWRIDNIEPAESRPGYSFTLGGHEMRISRYGRHNINNAAAAATVGFLMDAPAENIASALASAGPASGRGVLFRIGDVLVVDESYNANPASVMAAVDAFMELPVSGKRWLVLGDMLELGAESAELHCEVGIYCGKAGIDGLLTIGSESVELSRAAALQRKAPPAISHFLNLEKLAAHLHSQLAAGDGVLVKGSRCMHTERVIDELERLGEAARTVVD